jgi:hypothetical protein
MRRCAAAHQMTHVILMTTTGVTTKAPSEALGQLQTTAELIKLARQIAVKAPRSRYDHIGHLRASVAGCRRVHQGSCRGGDPHPDRNCCGRTADELTSQRPCAAGQGHKPSDLAMITFITSLVPA